MDINCVAMHSLHCLLAVSCGFYLHHLFFFKEQRYYNSDRLKKLVYMGPKSVSESCNYLLKVIKFQWSFLLLTLQKHIKTNPVRVNVTWKCSIHSSDRPILYNQSKDKKKLLKQKYESTIWHLKSSSNVKTIRSKKKIMRNKKPWRI